MKFTKSLILICAFAVFLAACNSAQTDETANSASYPNDDLRTENLPETDNDFYAKDNFDLQRVGGLLEKADNPEEFEYLLNSDNGINNLDLNGDGYADYISVAEYGDEGGNDRGFSLFSRFNGNDIQELATIIFDRDRPNRPGARVLLNGSEQLYGDDVYYERNWLDKSLDIADWVFGSRENTYQSPYYYDNYPDDYETYRVVETPVYRTRVADLYPEPVFIQTSRPEIGNITIKSPYYGRTVNNIHAKLVKPTKEQREFLKNNPNPPGFVKAKNGKVRNKPTKFEKESRNFDKSEKYEKEKRGKEYKPEKFDGKNDKPERGGKNDRKEAKKINKPDKGKGKVKGKKNDKGNGRGRGKGKGKN